MQGAERVCEGDKVDGQKNWKSFHRPVKKPRGNVENPVERVESLFFNKETLFCTSRRGIILVVPVEAKFRINGHQQNGC